MNKLFEKALQIVKNLMGSKFITFLMLSLFCLPLLGMTKYQRISLTSDEERTELRKAIEKALADLETRKKKTGNALYQEDLYYGGRGYSLLHYAVIARQHDLVEKIIDIGADVNALPSILRECHLPFWTPLHIACYNGDEESCRILRCQDDLLAEVQWMYITS